MQRPRDSESEPELETPEHAELSGYVTLGLAMEARRIVRRLLRRRQPSGPDLVSAVDAVISLGWSVGRWTPAILAAHGRLTARDRRRTKPAIFKWLIFAHEYERSLTFKPARTTPEPDHIVLLMDALLETGRLPEAGRLAIHAKRLLRRDYYDDFDRTLLCVAVANFGARAAELPLAEAAWRNAPVTSTFASDKFLGLAEAALAQAWLATADGLAAVAVLRHNPGRDFDLVLSHPKLEDELLNEAEGNLRAKQRKIGRLLPLELVAELAKRAAGAGNEGKSA